MWNPNIILTVKNRYQNIITLKQGLTQLINEFQQLMRFQLNPQEENEPTLPEYCIVEGPSIITKLRVVVDESKIHDWQFSQQFQDGSTYSQRTPNFDSDTIQIPESCMFRQDNQTVSAALNKNAKDFQRFLCRDSLTKLLWNGFEGWAAPS